MRLAVAAGLAVVIALAIAAAYWTTHGDDDATLEGHMGVIARVGDGDSLELRSGERVRLLQIDAPELGTGACYGQEATRELRRLVPSGTSVRIEPDLDRIDRFGRTLAYVERDGEVVNIELGAAVPWFVGGERGRYADELLDAARDARAERRGLWSECPETELDPRRGLRTDS